MGNEQGNLTTRAPKLKWNDIRIVGPVLIMVLAAAIMINPSFVSARNSVGGDLSQCELAIGAIDPCCNFDTGIVNPCLTPTSTAVPPTSTATPVPPTTTAVPTTTSVPATATPVPSAVVVPSRPTVRAQPIPGEIVGPTWLGPIRISESNGVVTLKFPTLLSLFIADARVLVSGGGVVYSRTLSANHEISFPIVNATATKFTVTTVLTNLAKYTEVVTLASSPS